MFRDLRAAKKQMTDKQFSVIQDKAEFAAQHLRQSEINLITVLRAVEDHMVHRWCGFNSLFQYCLYSLKLSRSQAYMYSHLAQAARKFGKLETALRDQSVTPSKAARILSVINQDNQEEWVQKAAILSKDKLEKEVARLNPKKIKGERAEYINADVIDMKTPVSEDVYRQLIKVQDLLSQSTGKAVSMEGVFAALTKGFLKKNDPVEKAKRAYLRKVRKRCLKPGSGEHEFEGFVADVNLELKEKSQIKVGRDEGMEARALIDARSYPAKNSSGVRIDIPAEVLHRVYLRDQRECQHVYPSGQKCRASRWIHIHHKKPVAAGGDHSPNNLQTLCYHHHSLAHLLLDENAIAEKELTGREGLNFCTR